MANRCRSGPFHLAADSTAVGDIAVICVMCHTRFLAVTSSRPSASPACPVTIGAVKEARCRSASSSRNLPRARGANFRFYDPQMLRSLSILDAAKSEDGRALLWFTPERVAPLERCIALENAAAD